MSENMPNTPIENTNETSPEYTEASLDSVENTDYSADDNIEETFYSKEDTDLVETADDETEEDEEKAPTFDGHSTIMTLAGAYIIYLGYNLIKTFIEKIPGGWSQETVVCIIAGTVFMGFGAVLLYKYIKEYIAYSRYFKKKGRK